MNWIKNIGKFFANAFKLGWMISFIRSFFYSDYKASENSFTLSLRETICMIVTLGALFFAIFAPSLIELPRVSPSLLQDPSQARLIPPFFSLRELFGTDAYGRSIFSIFLLGLHKTFGVAVVAVLINAFITIPSALFIAYFRKPNGFSNSFWEVLLIFNPFLIYIIYISLFPVSLAASYLAVLISSMIYVFYNLYRDVLQLMQLPMMHIFKLEGINFRKSFTLILFPNLIPNMIRLLRRALVIIITELILINVMHLSAHANESHWGTSMYYAWIHRDLVPHALLTLTVLISVVLYCVLVALSILQNYISTMLARVREQRRLRRKLDLSFYFKVLERVDELDDEENQAIADKLEG